MVPVLWCGAAAQGSALPAPCAAAGTWLCHPWGSSVTQAADQLPPDEGNGFILDGKAFGMDENEGLSSFDADYRRLLASGSSLMLISALMGCSFCIRSVWLTSSVY